MTQILTDRLLIRDYEKSDLEQLHRLLSDKENMYFLNDIATASMEETAANLKVSILNEDGHYFALTHRDGGGFIGAVGYTITERTPIGNVVHMGYFILPEFKGKGYTTEAVRRVIDFAFTKDHCIRITTGCYTDHSASENIMKKTGFRKEGEMIKAQWHDGMMKDRLWYAMNREEYKG